MSITAELIDLEIDVNNYLESIIKIARSLKPNWSSNSDEEIQIRDLNGGVTNRLFACYLKSTGMDTPDTFLLRIYGKNTEQFISRDDEILTMKVMKNVNLGPDFYTRFKNGICYEYLPGSIIDNRMVNDANISTKIAEATANLHLVNFRGFLTESDLEEGQKPFVFAKTREMLNLVRQDYKANMPHMTDDYLKTIPSLPKLNEELDFLESYFKAYAREQKSLMVFSHNDLLLGNIIYNEKNNTIKFIDYEYAALNYQAYDIANHFTEFSGVEEPDYSLYPDKKYQLRWLRIYLEAFYSKLNRFFTKQTDEPVLVDDGRLEKFYNEVNKFTLAAHLMWAVWSLVQAQNSQLEFNFVKYGKARFDEYFHRKSQLSDQ